MSNARDGMNYVPQSAATKKVVEPGEFVFAASHFDHGHIYGQINGLATAGGTLKYMYDSDPARCEKVLKDHPDAKIVTDFQQILDDPEIKLVTSAAIPNQRCAVGLQVMDAGKDYLTDKSPFTTLDQLAQARAKVKETGRKYAVCYSERLMNEGSFHAAELARQGVIGDILQVLILAPHNLNAPSRPDWFFQKEGYGGVLTDIGSHQFEQFLYITNSTGGSVNYARVDNFANPDHPGLEDFGEASITLSSGASAYCRIDWFNPAGLRTWGDGRTFILGTKGYMEVRKYIDVARETGGNRIFLVDGNKEQEIDCAGKVGFRFFGDLIQDVLNGTENAQGQDHAFMAAELSMKAQKFADDNRK